MIDSGDNPLSGGIADTPEMLRALLATQDKELGTGASNRGHYSNPAFDTKLNEAMRTLDDAKREAILQEATRMAMADTGLIPIHIQKNAWALRHGLSIDARADEYTRAQDVRPAD